MEEKSEVITVSCTEDLREFECEMTTDMETALRGIHSIISSFCDTNNFEYEMVLSILMAVYEEYKEEMECIKVESEIEA